MVSEFKTAWYDEPVNEVTNWVKLLYLVGITVLNSKSILKLGPFKDGLDGGVINLSKLRS